MDTQHELLKYEIFNASRYYIKDLITELDFPSKYFITGGTNMLNLFEGKILDDIKDKIEQYGKLNNNLNYQFLLSLIYTQDINIITDTINNANTFSEIIKKSIRDIKYSDTKGNYYYADKNDGKYYVKYFFNYIFISICRYYNWDTEKQDITFEIKSRNTKDDNNNPIIKISLYVNNYTLNLNIKFDIIDIMANNTYQNSNLIKNIYDVYKYEIEPFVSKMASNKKYINSNKKNNRVARYFLYFNMFINKYVIQKKMSNTIINEMKTDNFINEFTSSFRKICNEITKKSINIFIIRRTQNNFTIEFSSNTLGYFNELQKNNNINNLIHGTINYIEYKSSLNIDTTTFDNNNILFKSLENFYNVPDHPVNDDQFYEDLIYMGPKTNNPLLAELIQTGERAEQEYGNSEENYDLRRDLAALEKKAKQEKKLKEEERKWRKYINDIVKKNKNVKTTNKINGNYSHNDLLNTINRYYNSLKILDKDKIIRDFTLNYYLDMNSYLSDRIYLISAEKDKKLDNDIQQINNIIVGLSNTFNDDLFKYDDHLYVWRGDSNRMIGEHGSFYNIKNGDKIYSHTPISTSFYRPFEKNIILKIKLDRNSYFAIISKYSQVPHEREILLPYGSVLEVTNTSYIQVNFNDVFLIEADYVLFQMNDIKTHIYEYKNLISKYWENENRIVPTLMFSKLSKSGLDHIALINPKSLTSVAIDMTLITNTLEQYEIKVLNELDSIKPYKDFIKKTKGKVNIAKLPPFNSKKAYIGENINTRRLKNFCKIEDFAKFERTKHNLNLLTFNVHNFVKICSNTDADKFNLFGDIESTDMRNIRYFDNFMSILDKFANVDIICLQEIVPLYGSYPKTQGELKKGSFAQLIEIMDDYDFRYYSLANANYNYKDFNDNYFILGNAIFSKIKPNKVYRYGLFGNRCAIVNNITYNYNDYNIINVHLEWDHYKMSSSKGTDIEIQITQLENILNMHPNYILMGDFNSSVFEDDIFKNIRLDSTIISPKNNVGSYTGINSGKIIDYIIASNNIFPFFDVDWEISDKIIYNSSDHYPVFASLIPKLNINLINPVNLNGTLYKELTKTILKAYKENANKNEINMLFTNKYKHNCNLIDIYIVPDKYTSHAYSSYYYLPLVGNRHYIQGLIYIITELDKAGKTVNIYNDNSVNIYNNLYNHLKSINMV